MSDSTDSLFSYLNNTIYGITLRPNLDFRIEVIQAMPGCAMIYFTDGTIPRNASNIVPPDPQFTIVDSQGNNLNIVVLNGITCFVVSETRGYTMSLGGQVVFKLKTQIQQCTIVGSGLNYFTI